jgi:hypothetical protein
LPSPCLLGRPTSDLDFFLLPDGSGFEVCSRLREGEPGRAWDRDVPVIMVSARGDPVDRVRGFSRGCDDYVVKPFVYDELVARMRAVLRRTSGPRHARIAVRDLEIDLAARIVTVAGEQVQLSAKEYELLVALADDPERVFKEGGAPSRRLGIQVTRADADARLACLAPPPQAEPKLRGRVRAQRVGSRTPPHRTRLTLPLGAKLATAPGITAGAKTERRRSPGSVEAIIYGVLLAACRMASDRKAFRQLNREGLERLG